MASAFVVPQAGHAAVSAVTRAPSATAVGRAEYGVALGSVLLLAARRMHRGADLRMHPRRMARRAVKEREDQKTLEKFWETVLANRPPRNEDTGPLTRLGSVLAYLLPLTDALRFGMFLFVSFPVIQPLLDLLVVPALFINGLPFGLGYLTLFITMQAVAANRQVPALLRYNLRQAITLNVFLVFMSLFGDALKILSGAAFGWPVPLDIAIGLSTGIYLLVTGCCLYSIACSLAGRYPRGLGPVSEAAELQLMDTQGDTFFVTFFKDKPEE
ncbi:unnamed protein product [Effrenium voratum]|uniref:Tic20 family protein Ycf60 n=1 Tax=Effrenium voratum TaxID=2562239 RepID=A0AA36HY07_9DINO|nr:unnamed protein product [Effrenium voratum]